VHRLPLTQGSQERAARELEAEAWPIDLRLNVDVPGAFVLVPGRAMPRVAETLASPKVDALIVGLKDSRDFVIVLAPPLLAEADGLALAHLVDAVIIVCDRRLVRKEDLEIVRDAVRGTGGTIAGAVLVLS
jgi:tyrosine-protein kinase